MSDQLSPGEAAAHSARTAAEHVLADRRWFMLEDDAWEAFNDLHERPAVFKPRLAELLSEQSNIFEH
jgi:uncharacterized protein (DUF1778 family)